MSARRYVVTGAASGIGREVAAVLLAEGHRVVAVDRSDAVPSGCEPVIADLSDRAMVDALVDRLATDGPYDGLANVAGVPGTSAPGLVLAVNFLAARALAEGLAEAFTPGASVVHVASLAARRPGIDEDAARRLVVAPDDEVRGHAAASGIDGSAAYDLSKRMLVLHTALLAARFLGRGTRVCAVSPGPVDTPILGDFRTSMGPSVDASADVVGRLGRSGEVAGAVVFLLSPAASWVNGVDLPVDGGLLAARTAASLHPVASQETRP